MAAFVNVAIPIGVRRTFTYSVPSTLRSRASVGARVLVPFGRRAASGFIVGLSDRPPEGGFKVRAVREILDPEPLLPGSLVDTVLRTADYYFTSPGALLAAVLPAGSRIPGVQKVRLSPKAEGILSGGLQPTGLTSRELEILHVLKREGCLTREQLASLSGLRNAAKSLEPLQAGGWVSVEDRPERPRVGPKTLLGIRALEEKTVEIENLTANQNRLYSLLPRGGSPLPLGEVLRLARTTAGVARALARKGLAEIAPLTIDRVPVELAELTERKKLDLTAAQKHVYEELRRMVEKREATRCLLHGVTGSGKTEIYLRLIADVLSKGSSAILMVPEIGLTPMLSRIALSHFPEQVALLHSGMAAGERYDQWRRIRSGNAKLVVGTRSAVFAPVDDPRLIILDEEQDASYKQDESPCYHARRVAWQRVRQSDGLLLLGSATPSIETYYRAKELNELHYLNLPERVEARRLPEVTIVDMSMEFERHGKQAVISEKLQLELARRLKLGQQSIILLNRRGYSRSLLCRSCGHAFSCPDCSISMTYHQEQDLLICHYCGHERGVPRACANCGGEFIYFVGVGTEQLEKILRGLFPKARLARVDRDTTRRKGAIRRVLLDFADGKLDLLVGTQMLAKGHDFPNLTLVGVVGADAGLSFPDFRAAERTFQLLTQVAGRAGRGEVPGVVVIQSFYPDHYALKFARSQSYEEFHSREIEYRRLLGYPPFKDLIQILVSADDATKGLRTGEKTASVLRRILREHGLGSEVRILGPAPAPFEKLRGKYRFQILIKSSTAGSMIPILHDAFGRLGRHRISLKSIHVDVDPLSLL